MAADPTTPDKDSLERVQSALKASYADEPAFNAALTAKASIVIPSQNPYQDVYRFDAAEVLYWLDRDSYNAELALWKEAEFSRVHNATIKFLKQTGQTTLIHDLAAAFRRRRIAPFVGAGMSAFAFPTWRVALEELNAKSGSVDPAQLKVLLDKYKYLQAAQLLWDANEVAFKNFVFSRFAKSQVDRSRIAGPIKLLPKFSHGCVITTNFDSVIETVLGDGVLEAYMHGTQKGNKFVPRLIRGDRCLLKLHGDAEDYETYIFTHQQYLDGYGKPTDFSKPLPSSLRQIFVSHSLLFLGCSLEDDWTLDLFREVCSKREFHIPDHFAILPEPTRRPAKQQKESRLLELKIRPLWYPAKEHSKVEEFLALAIAMNEIGKHSL